MSYTNNGISTFSLSLIAILGLMIFLAGGAQANWLLLLANGTLDELTGDTEGVKVKEHSELISLLLSNGVKIRCETLAGEDVLLQPGNATTAEATGKVAFSNCHTFDKNGTAAPKCDPLNQPVKASGKAHIILHGGKNYMLFNPPEGLEGFFAIVKIDEELCALIETSEVTGSLVAECGQLNKSGIFVGEDCKVHAVSHLLQQAPQALFPSDELRFGELKASLDGIANLELAEDGIGLAWSGEV